MAKLNYWPDKWDLHPDICPCDVHVNEWLAAQKMTGKLIYHFGTGTHHVVGKEQAVNGSGNTVLGITASMPEYEAYMKLVAVDARVAKSYVAYFCDIYLTNPKLLPDFDVVTMVHLCEFFHENTTSKEYGGADDRGVLDIFTAKTKPGGHILFYTKSIGFDKAQPVIEKWAKEAPVTSVGEFKTLAVYRKT